VLYTYFAAQGDREAATAAAHVDVELAGLVVKGADPMDELARLDASPAVGRAEVQPAGTRAAPASVVGGNSCSVSNDGDIDMVDRQGRSELHYSALEGTADQTRELLAAGQDPNLADRDGFVPLHLAAQQGNVEVAEVLLEAGAIVDAVNKYGNTPLFVAVFNSKGQGDVIQLLRRYGANPRRGNGSGQTPVGLARLIANYDVKQFFDDVE